MKKSYWLSVLAYLLPTFPLGYAWHLVTFKEAYDRLELFRADVIIPLGLATMLVQALIFAWIYPKLFSTRRDEWLASAARFGALFAVLSWSFTTLPVAAKYQMTSVYGFLLLETAFTIVQWVIVAPLIALAQREAHEPVALAAGSLAGKPDAS